MDMDFDQKKEFSNLLSRMNSEVEKVLSLTLEIGRAMGNEDLSNLGNLIDRRQDKFDLMNSIYQQEVSRLIHVFEALPGYPEQLTDDLSKEIILKIDDCRNLIKKINEHDSANLALAQKKRHEFKTAIKGVREKRKTAQAYGKMLSSHDFRIFDDTA
ncbi:MAG: hypothetical protein HQK60_02685 [Deltaproteobacteria bacterium]|nr:hypothetical protein [Deltaproteobacteria bacterium]